MKVAPSRGVGMGREANSKGQLHDLQGPVQNENASLFLQKHEIGAVFFLPWSFS